MSRTCATGWRRERRRLILLMSVSIDGFAGRRDRTIDWPAPSTG
jgi:hypothetical protein